MDPGESDRVDKTRTASVLSQFHAAIKESCQNARRGKGRFHNSHSPLHTTCSGPAACGTVIKPTLYFFFMTLAQCVADAKAVLTEKRSVGIDIECCAFKENSILENTGG